MLFAFSTLFVLALVSATPSLRGELGSDSGGRGTRVRRHARDREITDIGPRPSVVPPDIGREPSVAPPVICDTAGYQTGLGSPFTFECEGNEVIWSVESRYCSSPSDRTWAFQCGRAGSATLDECFWSPYINDFGGFMGFQCPFNSLVTGFYSSFREDRSDRRWKVKCCTPKSRHVFNCLTSLPSNEWRDVMNFTSPLSYHMRGICSDVSTGKRDRRYQFDLCKLWSTDNYG